MKPLVALLGRPNVGKSTLFNRMTNSRKALVDNFPGVTRDRHYAGALWNNVSFNVVDTGGFLKSDDDYFAAKIKEQLNMAVHEADVLVLILDGKSGLSVYDYELVDFLRKFSKPVFYVINKTETLKRDVYDFYSLGIDKFYKIAAEHNIGVSSLLDDIIGCFSDINIASISEDTLINIAVVGRPNAGKSSLVNKLFGEKRLIVDEKAGTTRNSIELDINYNGKKFKLIDTAGIRRRGKVKQKIEKFSVVKSLQSLDECDVALVVIDSEEGVTDQDIHIAGYAEKRKCGVVFICNKWDLLKKEYRKKFLNDLKFKVKFLSFAPVVSVSALTGYNIDKTLGIAESVFKEYCFRINTGALNRIVENAVYRSEPSLHKGRRIKFYYSTQVAIKPPSFVCFSNYPEAVHFSYKRYLINQIRKEAELNKTPVNLYFRIRTGKIDFSQNNNKKRNLRS